MAVCLLGYMAIYDHCVNKVSLKYAFTKLVRNILMSGFLYFALIVAIVGGIFWVVYSLMHNAPLF